MIGIYKEIQGVIILAKYSLNKQELIEHWNDQLNFIRISSKNYDEGNEQEARRIATSLRIMIHQTKYSHSLYKQLNPTFIFWSSGSLYTPSNLLSSWVLLSMNIDVKGIRYTPILNNNDRTFFLTFEDWWNEIIFDDKEGFFSRRDVVLYVANQDGGSHVDPSLDEAYAKLTKFNSLGWVDNNGNKPINNPAYAAIRAIANEILVSQELSLKGLANRKRQKERKFEMRFVDTWRRFKWSTTEIKCSEETVSIVNHFRKEDRTLYIQEFKGGLKVELVG